MLIDTHCHIHWKDFPLDISDLIQRANTAGVARMICIGTNISDSKLAVKFASSHKNVYSSIGVHPNDSRDKIEDLDKIINSNNRSIVAIGEIGLDYFHKNCPHDIQIKALNKQIELALKNDLPIIFHVRDAFEDFWPIFDNFITNGQKIRGELHSFTDNQENLEEALKRDLYIGVNGFSTFTKNKEQQILYANIPLENLLLETDAPFLTPVPFRGKVNEPAYVWEIAKWQSEVRQISFDEIASITTANANKLFRL
ncbi:MAG TPA: TatD family hydrolase [Candidatus Saccharibacteria bacterium]|nr:TatD family hydrolase [Candidatus Saccharibacteria bacterium]